MSDQHRPMNLPAPSVVPPALAETGKPTLLFFSRNTVSSKTYGVPDGIDYGQAIEPAGEYLVVDERDLSGSANPDREYGVIAFRNPLVIDHKNTTSTGWKKDLSDRFGGKTGMALTTAIKQAGHDGVLTRDAYGYSESVNIAGTKIQLTDYSCQAAELNHVVIDRALRPTVNAQGQPLHDTLEGVLRFWQWFGDSSLVDATGRPLVFYHGTKASFSSFSPESVAPVGKVYPEFGLGFYFSPTLQGAEGYATHHARGKGEPRVISAYLRGQNFMAFDLTKVAVRGMFAPGHDPAFTPALRAAGKSGVIIWDEDADADEKRELQEVMILSADDILIGTTLSLTPQSVQSKDSDAGPGL